MKSFALLALIATASSSARALSPEFWAELDRAPAPLAIFREISKIPRPSFKEHRVRTAVYQMAEQAIDRHWAGLGVAIERDPRGNLIIRLPGRGRFAAGYKPVAVQAHFDMVMKGETDADLARLEAGGVDVVETDGWLHSRDSRTTLGADNGMGMALALKYLVKPLADQMPLEILITVEEEDGMGGAKNLGAKLRAGCLINLDWDNVRVIGHACTGSERIVAERSTGSIYPSPRADDAVIDLRLRKLPGGHSGIDIAERRPNAAIMMAGILRRAFEGGPTLLHSFTAGDPTKLNVIPSEARARLLTSRAEAADLRGRLTRAFARSRYRTPAARFDVDEKTVDDAYADGTLGDPSYSFATTDLRLDDYLAVFEELYDGPLSPRRTFPGWEASSNLGFARVADGVVEAGVMVRAFGTKEGRVQGNILRRQLRHYGLRAASTKSTFNPGWTADTSTFLYRAARDADPSYELSVAPGGLELAPLEKRVGKIPATSIGPTIKDLHAVTERVEVQSVIDTEVYLDELITRLGGCEEMLLAR